MVVPRGARISAVLSAMAMVLASTLVLAGCAATPRPARALTDQEIQRVMRREQVQGLALAVVEGGKPGRVRVFGMRNAASWMPMSEDTILSAGALTQAAFVYMVLQLADEGRLDLDAPLTRLLPQPLPAYRDRPFDYADLADEPRWRSLTPRILLRHAGGFADHRWYEPDERLRIHFDPGSRYAYSSEGVDLLQMVLERGLGLDVAREMQVRVFSRLAMTRSSMRWRPESIATAAETYGFDGSVQPHQRNYRVRAAGSMDTTIGDQVRLWAGIVRGEGLSAASRALLTEGALPIATAREFPTLEGDPATWPQGLAAGLGVLAFRDRDGAAFFQGSRDDWSANFVLCRETGQRCVIVMSNDVRAERLVPELAQLALNGTELPWPWFYRWAD